MDESGHFSGMALVLGLAIGVVLAALAFKFLRPTRLSAGFAGYDPCAAHASTSRKVSVSKSGVEPDVFFACVGDTVVWQGDSQNPPTSFTVDFKTPCPSAGATHYGCPFNNNGCQNSGPTVTSDPANDPCPGGSIPCTKGFKYALTVDGQCFDPGGIIMR